jgi:hypothetical protein
MQEQKQQAAQNERAENKNANPGHGPQGVDKAPGEEPSEDNVQFTQETQKGKKVDADPSKESDKPANQSL